MIERLWRRVDSTGDKQQFEVRQRRNRRLLAPGAPGELGEEGVWREVLRNGGRVDLDPLQARTRAHGLELSIHREPVGPGREGYPKLRE